MARIRPSDSDDASDDASEEIVDMEPASMPKRQRKAATSDSDSDDDDQDNSQEHQSRERRSTNNEPAQPSRSNSGRQRSQPSSSSSKYPDHHPGAVVRIRLTNFLTYAAIEFFPGPCLNMVVGPNGTGKSTVVCALALGLGGKPDVLGRARELQEFVKHGEDRATIELELKPPANYEHQTLVIQRSFERGSNQSSWRLNNRPAKERDIRKIVDSLSIQVDNLCQFLPQDRVSGFAQMSPQDLLRETERAAGGQEMIDMHVFLTEQRNAERELDTKIRDLRSTVDGLRRRNQTIEPDVQRVREREDMDRRIRILNSRIAGLDYENKRDAYLETKNERARIQEEYDTLRSREQPLRDECNRLREELNHHDTRSRDQRTKYTQETNRIKEAIDEASHKSEEQENIQSEIDSIDRDRERRRKEIDAERKKLDTFRVDFRKIATSLSNHGLCIREDGDTDAEKANEMPDNTLFRLHSDHKACMARLGELHQKAAQNNSRKQDLAQQTAQLRLKYTNRQRDLERFDQIREQKLNAIQRIDPDTYNATMWLRQNGHLFQQQVFEPVCLEINVREPKYASAIEAVVNKDRMMTFVAQNETDYRTFSREVIDMRKHRVNIVCFNRSLDSWIPDTPREQLQRMGFDGYLLDFVEGPDAVLAALCQMCYLHATPVSLNPIRDLQPAEHRFNSFIANGVLYNVRRAYGESSTRARNLNPQAQFLGQTVDPEIRRRLEDECALLFNRLNAITNQVKAIEVEAEEIRKHEATEKQRRDEIRAGISEIHELRDKGVHVRTKIEMAETRLAGLERASAADLATADNRLAALRERAVVVSRERAKVAERLYRAYESSTRVFLNRTKAVLSQLAASMRLENLEEQIRASDASLADHVTRLNQIKETLQQRKHAARDALNKLDAEKDKLTEEDIEHLNTINETGVSVDDLITQVGALTTLAETVARINPAIVEEYEKRRMEIDQNNGLIQEREASLAALQKRMELTKAKWTSRLTHIVNRISSSFSAALESIGCAGEVQLHQDETDYAKWGIQILVKFRDHESLQVLTSSRQSGGERSVSTMVYLMSLQSLSKSPFRVVDEINQGMDPRNERVVHSLIVKAACLGGLNPNQSNSEDDEEEETISSPSQYFLITPKLLHDLEYHRNMTVLCILNGPWQPPFAGTSHATNTVMSTAAAMMMSPMDLLRRKIASRKQVAVRA